MCQGCEQKGSALIWAQRQPGMHDHIACKQACLHSNLRLADQTQILEQGEAPAWEFSNYEGCRRQY